jgi:hypothetical protein
VEDSKEEVLECLLDELPLKVRMLLTHFYLRKAIVTWVEWVSSQSGIDVEDYWYNTKDQVLSIFNGEYTEKYPLSTLLALT